MDNAKRATYKRAAFNELAARGIYGTSRDFNLRELEIDFIVEAIRPSNAGLGREPRIVDLGCGNGYTTLRTAAALQADILGIDFAEALIAEARELSTRFADSGHPMPRFEAGDITEIELPESHFDVVVTGRVLLNLVDRTAQEEMLKRICKVLVPGGIYVLVEGDTTSATELCSPGRGPPAYTRPGVRYRCA